MVSVKEYYLDRSIVREMDSVISKTKRLLGTDYV